MPKIYTKTTWLDEVLSGAIRYDIKENGGTAFKSDMQILLKNSVAQIGTAVTAAIMNNLENGVDALDTILSSIRSDATQLTIASGVITVTQSNHKLQPESGFWDELVTVNGAIAGQVGVFYPADFGADAIVFRHNVGNILCENESDIVLKNGFVLWYSNGTKVFINGSGIQNERLNIKPEICEYHNLNDGLFGLTTAVIGAGTIAILTHPSGHPGSLRVSANGANTGGASSSATNTPSIRFEGGETFEFIFRHLSASDTRFRVGFIDTFTTTAPTDGAWLDMVNGFVSGKTRNNSTESTTGTSQNLATLNAWYRLKIVVNSDATRVDFYIYDANGVQLWTDNLTTNIPTAAGRETSLGWVAYKTTAGALDIFDVDWAKYYNNKTLPR